ncbi:hypothetical protein NDU88_004231 [Pleurodeles waltl]|uniref:Uncharacterized protein n=1 Tax=Pleurodeles waltl TaxID=8319 RepID=A0AAV7UGJ5_PLEWA|nr:hypothetical protein NDU88_004231 [Pleurodeles waltl]
MLHNLTLRRQVPFLEEDEAGDGHVAAVDPVDSDDEEAEDEDEDNRKKKNIIVLPVTHSTVVCTANGLLRLNVRRGDSGVIMLWAWFCWRNGVGFDTPSLSLTFGLGGLVCVSV